MAQRDSSSRPSRDLAPCTLTHARLRVAQGDVATARMILQTMLRRDPGDTAAVRALEELGQRRARAARLRRWLGKIERG